ncbi:serine/threonine-protein kinase [Fodinibius halophilus]|uniref:Serine/threonine protein kinase n=1 Tax=Fodinibius halophilus TaxID=1736908 RepID=A0A6M1SST4_9BACT|nr:serine/threonine-protein kinase [Fodinibius halophilus]NGP86998.1 serine/threonine protein kinase [Fodinibius halophilus]
MDHANWDRVEEILDKALTKSENERQPFIEQQCGDNKQLKSWITELLESIESSEGFLETGSVEKDILIPNIIEDLPDEHTSSLVGKQLGAYSITELIEHGGMGSVYLAERSDGAFQHKVAIKIIRRGMDTPSNIARFKQEQNILASLHHPHIGRLYDGGVTNEGLPYLVMEYIDGQPINEYCDEHTLSIDERLSLFRKVCEAVQYAHNNLVIHRDLKPANILITPEGEVKILDFGIAKLLDSDSEIENIHQTRAGARMLTLAYAAPEQINHETITTAADNYALGIVLYKLLIGIHPFEPGETKNRGALKKRITQKTAPKPSSHFRALDTNTQSKIAAKRGCSPHNLFKLISGDLDAIVCKSLRKNAADRYNSIELFIEDLRRFSNDQPITARAGHFRYVATKFLKRNKIAINTAAAFLIILIGLISYHTIQISQERNQAQLEAQKANQVKNFLVNILQSSDPFIDNSNPNLTLQEVLDNGAKKVQTELQGYPAIQADLLLTMGLIYENLALYPKAEAILTDGLKISTQLPEEDIQLKGNILQQLAASKMWQGRFSESDSLLQHMHDLFIDNFGPETPRLSPVYNDWGLLMQEWGKLDKAQQLYKRSIQLADLDFIDTTSLATMHHNLATVFKDQGKLDSAITYYNKTLEFRYQLTPEGHPATANTLSLLASALYAKGDLLSADSLHRKALKIRKQTLPPEHPHIAASQVRLGQVLLKLGKPKQAQELLTKAIPVLSNSFPENHWRVRAAKGVLAVSWMLQGRLTEAEQPLLNAFQTFKNRFGLKDWRTKEALKTLGQLYSAMGKPQQAVKYKNKLLLGT